MSSIKPIVYLFQQTSRAQTPDAPPYDPTRKVKSWVDTSPGLATLSVASYHVLDSSGKIVNLVLPVAEASTLNLPGHPDYPHYVAAPTNSAFAISGVKLPYGVSSLADAKALAGTFGLTDSAIFDLMGSFPGETINWDPNDPRRCYGIHFGSGSFAAVADLLVQQNAAGVGAPGEWIKDAAGNWSWKSELAPDPTNPDIMPMPIAPLAANEHIEDAGFGGMPVIVVDDPSPVPSGGSVDLSTDPTAQKILEGVTALRGVFHV